MCVWWCLLPTSVKNTSEIPYYTNTNLIESFVMLCPEIHVPILNFNAQESQLLGHVSFRIIVVTYIGSQIGFGIGRTNVICTHRMRIRRLCKTDDQHRTFFWPCLCCVCCLCLLGTTPSAPLLEVNKTLVHLIN